MSVTRFADFLSASLGRRRPGDLKGISPAETEVIEKIAAAVDDDLAEMVRELESAARCQQVDMRGAGEDAPPFTAFCVGMRQIGQTLLPHLFSEFTEICRSNGVQPAHISWIAFARSEALVAYLLQLATVHGLAFEGAPSVIGASERVALEELERVLLDLMRTENEKL